MNAPRGTRTIRRIPWGLLWLAGTLAILALLRARLVERSLASNAVCEQCFTMAVLAHDAWLLALGWGLLALSSLTGRMPLRVALVLPVMLLALLMSADVAILATLGLRIYLTDALKFGGQGAAIGDFAAALLRSSGRMALIAALAGLAACLAAFWPYRRSAPAAAGLALAALSALVVAFSLRASGPAYVHAESYLNLFELHAAQTVNAGYSQTFVLSLQAADKPMPPVCEAGQSRRPNLIVLIVESLSSYQSALHGGPLDYTPELDKLAQAHTWFDRFHANGFTTDHGLIALLAGEVPVPSVGRYRSLDAFSGYGSAQQSVVAPLHQAGYEAGFFTTGNLGFLDKAPWLRSLGFNHWEGAEHTFYAGWPRYAFGAAEDRALYQRLLQWMDQRSGDRPFAAFALTVQSHPPFVDTATGRLDEAAVMRAVDHEAARFVAELTKRRFFDQGLLLITGDHRSMTPLHPVERRTFGARAFARVPLIVIGASGLPAGRIDAPFQQTDLLPSVTDMVAPEACVTPDQGLLLRATPRAPSWITHVRGDQRNRIDIYGEHGSSALILAGDDSRWEGTVPENAQAISGRIHRKRIELGSRESDVPAMLQLFGRE